MIRNYSCFPSVTFTSSKVVACQKPHFTILVPSLLWPLVPFEAIISLDSLRELSLTSTILLQNFLGLSLPKLSTPLIPAGRFSSRKYSFQFHQLRQELSMFTLLKSFDLSSTQESHSMIASMPYCTDGQSYFHLLKRSILHPQTSLLNGICDEQLSNNVFSKIAVINCPGGSVMSVWINRCFPTKICCCYVIYFIKAQENRY